MNAAFLTRKKACAPIAASGAKTVTAKLNQTTMNKYQFTIEAETESEIKEAEYALSSMLHNHSPVRFRFILRRCEAKETPTDSKPWALPEPPAGQSWHRDDWTEEMLPDGWRPLLNGEQRWRATDEVYHSGVWHRVIDEGQETGKYICHCRTRRPLPAKKMVPLTGDDVRLGDWIRHNPSGRIYLIIERREDVIWYGRCECHLSRLREDYSISRDNGKTWESCEKEGAP